MSGADSVSGAPDNVENERDTPARQTREEIRALRAARRRRKRLIITAAVAGVIGLLALLVYSALKRPDASIRYGICRVLAELQLRYPHTMQVTSISDRGGLVRIFYSYIDAFGSGQMDTIECEFKTNPQQGLHVAAARLNRQEIPPAELVGFNKVIPVIIANPPDLSPPRRRGRDLVDLKVDYY